MGHCLHRLLVRRERESHDARERGILGVLACAASTSPEQAYACEIMELVYNILRNMMWFQV